MVLNGISVFGKLIKMKPWKKNCTSKASLTLTYLGYFAMLKFLGGGELWPPPKISTMDGPINLKIGTDTE